MCIRDSSKALDWSAQRMARTSRSSSTSTLRAGSQRSRAASSKTARHTSGSSARRGRQRSSGCRPRWWKM
eukprot:15190576-Alexandrium_andersonii.AAC.1